MARSRWLAAAMLGGLLVLGACTAGDVSNPISHSATMPVTVSSTGTVAAPTIQSQPTPTFHPVGAQVAEVAHLRRFLSAYNAGHLDTALAQFSRSEPLGFSDCDYQTQQVVTGHGHAELARWLQTNIAHHDQLTGATIFGATLDQTVLGVSFDRRNSELITGAGHPDGITPSLGAKVKFDRAGLITEFNNGPVGGLPDACRIG